MKSKSTSTKKPTAKLVPISFSPIGSNPNWSGSAWSIVDQDQLATFIARVALGQYRHVLRVLAGTNCLPHAPAATALEGAKKLLTAANPAEPWHRDGWMFQVMSWIAAHLQGEATLIAPPHMIHAHKGFDGVHIVIDDQTKNVVSVVICEEKATDNPRSMITSEVWPEFKSLQSGERDNELVAEVTSLLEKHKGYDVDQTVEGILWSDSRAYRVAITVGHENCDHSGQMKLFKGFETVVSGNVSRRRGETLHLDDLREWMRQLASKAIAAVETMES